MSRSFAVLALASSLVVTACGGDAKKTAKAPRVLIPARLATSAESLLAYVPSGADLVLELDLKRDDNTHLDLSWKGGW